MPAVEQDGQPNGVGCEEDTGTIKIKKLYGRDEMPPGSVTVAKRLLARYAQPGGSNAPHGVPPIGLILWPGGQITVDEFDDAEELRVLPFRYPFYSRAYALQAGDVFAVLRNVQPFELQVGQWVVVQFNDTYGWEAKFGQVGRMELGQFALHLNDSTTLTVDVEHIQFVGKVMAWWDDA